MGVPHFAISNEELAKKPPIRKTATCPNCKKQHEVKFGMSKRLKPDGTYAKPKKSTMGFITCDCSKGTYLVSIDGKAL